MKGVKSVSVCGAVEGKCLVTYDEGYLNEKDVSQM